MQGLIAEGCECFSLSQSSLLTYYVLLGLSHPISEAQLPSLKHGAKPILFFLTKVRVLEQNQTFKK